MNDFFLHMKSHPLYEDFERALLEYRPRIPPHNVGEDNTERWKYESAKREGFDLCLTIFEIGVENDR